MRGRPGAVEKWSSGPARPSPRGTSGAAEARREPAAGRRRAGRSDRGRGHGGHRARAVDVRVQQRNASKGEVLGLEPEHFDNIRAKFRGLFRHLWHPVFFEAEGNLAGARVSAMLPKDTPDAQRDRIVMFVTRPVLSSGGARFLPPLVEEDLLVEAFDEGPAGADVARTVWPRRSA